MKIEDLSWHDGVLLDHHFRPNYNGHAELELMVELYPEQIHSQFRNRYNILCKERLAFSVELNAIELADNSKAGNINSARYDKNTLEITLFGGKMLIQANSFDVREQAGVTV